MVKGFVQYNDLFDEEIGELQQEVRERIKLFNKTQLLLMLIEILNSASKPNFNDSEQIKLLMELDETKILIIDDIYRKVGNIHLFFRGQILELIDNVLSLKEDDYERILSIDDYKNKRKVLEALLICSDIFSMKNYSTFHDQNLSIHLNAIAFRKGIEYSNVASEYYFYIAKTKIILEQLLDKYIKDYKEMFEDSVGFKIEDYITCYTFILTFLNNGTYNKTGLFKIEEITRFNEIMPELEKFFKSNSIDVDEFYEYKPDAKYEEKIVKYPILKIKDLYIICDYMNMLYLMLYSPFFMFHGSRKKWFSILGGVIEDYANTIFERIYPGSKFLENRYQTNVEYYIGKERYQIDFIIKNIDSIFIGEIKNAILNNDSLDTSKPEMYIDILKERYGVNSENSTKGFGQLYRTICHYVDGNISSLEKFNKIFPILVVNDNLVSTALTNSFFINEFEKLFGKVDKGSDKAFFYKGYKVFPLILISINELEYFEKTIEKYGFEKLLIEYNNYNESGNVSITEFIHDNEIKVFNNTYLAEIGYKNLEEMAEKLMPDILERVKANRKNET